MIQEPNIDGRQSYRYRVKRGRHQNEAIAVHQGWVQLGGPHSCSKDMASITNSEVIVVTHPHLKLQ